MRKMLRLTALCGLVASSVPSVGLAQAAATAASNPNEPVKLEKFEVTGSNIKRVDVEGPSPIKIITRQEIEYSGRTNLTDMLRELPESGQIGINEAGTVSAVRGSTALDLRGLGANNTLVIVNGRRVAPTGNNSGGTVFVDLNRFPLAMVERVEVLKDGASAIYGADATSGVVNVILRKDYNGAEVGVSYGNSTRTDVAEKTFTFFGGAASGKASATVGITYFERGALRASDTSFANNADLSARFAARGAAYASNAGWSLRSPFRHGSAGAHRPHRSRGWPDQRTEWREYPRRARRHRHHASPRHRRSRGLHARLGFAQLHQPGP